MEIKVLILATQKVNVAILDANAYCAASRLKGVEIFAISMKDLKYLTEKQAREGTNSKTIVPELILIF